MKARVQSKHRLNEELLANIWRRSSSPDECFSDWRRKSQTNLGVFSSDFIFFWANWFCTNKGLTYVFDPDAVGKPEEWRIIVDLPDDAEKPVVIKEDDRSVYVYRFDTEEITRFLIVGENWPQLLKIPVVDEIPKWLAEKIAAAKEEKSPLAIENRLNGLAARLEQLKQRRG